MITLHLDEHEPQSVIELIEREIPNLRDDRKYRDFLKSQERLLEKLLATVKAQTTETASGIGEAETHASPL